VARANLSTLLKLRGIGVTELAKRAQVARKTLNNVMNARNGASLDVLEALATALAVPAWVVLLPGLEKIENLEQFIQVVNSLQKLTPESMSGVAALLQTKQ
jgi:transcriptional regulator with XRE-family HTH domain